MLTPLDIENKKFSKQMVNGYSVEEVDDFLDELTKDYGKAYKESTEAKKTIDELTQSLAHYKNIEETLQSTLVMAQSTAEEVKNVARQQAEQIIKDAKGNAQKEADGLSQEINLKKKELDDIKKQFDVYKAKMEALLISQLELLKDINKEEDNLSFAVFITELLNICYIYINNIDISLIFNKIYGVKRDYENYRRISKRNKVIYIRRNKY